MPLLEDEGPSHNEVLLDAKDLRMKVKRKKRGVSVNSPLSSTSSSTRLTEMMESSTEIVLGFLIRPFSSVSIQAHESHTLQL